MLLTLDALNKPVRQALRITAAIGSLGLCLGAGSVPPLARAADPAGTVEPATGVPWHRDIAQARAASLVSKRPVLIIFTAAWSEASKSVQRTTLAAPEAAALITACYEPVNIDVDADPALTRSLGVSNIPAACVVDADGNFITRFDCPQEPAGFVAAAARAMQEAAQARSAVTTAAVLPREQSDFTKNSAVQTSTVAPAATAATLPVAPAPAVAVAPEPDAAEPALPAAPPAWRAEPAPPTAHATAQAPADSATSNAQRKMLEPAPTANAAPWLNANAAPTTATATPTPTATPAAPTAPPAANGAVAAAEPKPEKKSAADSFFAALKKPFTMFEKPKTAVDPKSVTAAKPESAVAATTPDPYGSMPLGLEGYCAVSLVEKGKWVEGRAQWGARHRGRTYLFAGPEQQQAFLADPDRYAPALSGDDPVLACDSGKQIAGQRRYGVTYQARTYLFSSPETRTAFAANPQRYTTRVKVAEQTSPTGTIVR